MADNTISSTFSSSSCIYVPESNKCYCVKVTGFVLGLLLTVATLATYFFGVNAIAVYTTAASAAICLMLSFALCASRFQKVEGIKKDQHPLTTPGERQSEAHSYNSTQNPFS